MTSQLAAVPLLAAIGIGAPALALAQEPEPPAPLVLSTPDPATRAPVSSVPRQPDRPVRIADTVRTPEASTPGSATGRVDGKTEVRERRPGGDGRGQPGAGESRGPRSGQGGGRGAGYPAHLPRGAVPGPAWWGPRPIHIVRPYDYDPFWVSGAFGWSPMFYAPWSLMWSTAGYGLYPMFGGSAAVNTGGVRLKMQPRGAQVLVDGYYAGIVDDFDGVFQALRLAPGGHKLEVRMPGFETFTLDVHVQPDRTMTVKESLRAIP